jgi:hypothetical protein
MLHTSHFSETEIEAEEYHFIQRIDREKKQTPSRSLAYYRKSHMIYKTESFWVLSGHACYISNVSLKHHLERRRNI